MENQGLRNVAMATNFRTKMAINGFERRYMEWYRVTMQCSCYKTWVMWSHLRVPVTKRAAAFCTACISTGTGCRKCRIEERLQESKRHQRDERMDYLSWPHQPTPITRPDVYIAGAGSSMLTDTRSWHASTVDIVRWQSTMTSSFCAVSTVAMDDEKNDAKMQLWDSETLWCVTECANWYCLCTCVGATVMISLQTRLFSSWQVSSSVSRYSVVSWYQKVSPGPRYRYRPKHISRYTCVHRCSLSWVELSWLILRYYRSIAQRTFGSSPVPHIHKWFRHIHIQ